MYSKKVKSSKQGFGRSSGPGYLKPSRDHMVPYRQPSTPESPYSRSVKNKIFRDEVSGPSGFLSRDYNYRNKPQIQYAETGLTMDEVNERIQDALKKVFEKHAEVSGVRQIPDETFHVALDAAGEVAKRMQAGKIEEKIETSDSISLAQLNEIRQEKIREKQIEIENAGSVEQVEQLSADIRHIDGEFFQQMDHMQNESKIEMNQVESMPVEQKQDTIEQIEQTNPLLESAGLKTQLYDSELTPDMNYEQRKRNLYDDSEIGY